MKYLMIENNGEIHEDALTLMGGSSKRGDESKIGMFGSGNKYTIACFLKKGVDFKIFSGVNQIDIQTKEYTFRETKLNKIYINGKETSLTTEMGPDWKNLWMGIREWIQNSYDEGGLTTVNGIEVLRGVEGKTRCYIEINKEVEDIVNNWDNYFTFDRTDVIFNSPLRGSIFPNKHPEQDIILFSRGIKCTEYTKRPSLFHYSGNIEMNESRIIKNEWQGKEVAANLLCDCNVESVIYSVLNSASKEKMFENSIWESWLSIKQLGYTWKQVIKDYKIIVSELAGWFENEQQRYKCFIVCESLCKRIKQAFPDVVIYGLNEDGSQIVKKKQIDIDVRKQFLLDEVNKWFKECRYDVEYPIVVVRFEDYDKLGLAADGTIYVSEKCFDSGKREIISTIVEENEHLKTGYKDKSLAFQNHWINLFISEKEQRFGFFN